MIVEVHGMQAHAATGGVELGNSTGSDDPVMVLIHGAGMDSTVWQLQTRYLAHHGLRPVAIDLPGHGRSDGEPLTNIVEMAHWVADFLMAANLSPAHVVGHSMGTFVALELARHHHDAVQSLVLLGTAAAMPVHPELLGAAENQLEKAAALMASWGLAKPAHIGLNPTPGLWMLGGARALVEMSQPGALAVDFTACTNYTDAGSAAAVVTCPVHVVIGSGDKMTPPKAAKKLTAEFSGELLDVTELSDVGHMMMIESPAEVRRVLTSTVANSTSA